MTFATIDAAFDRFLSHFTTKRGELRKMRRQLTAEIQTHQKERHELQEYVDAIKEFNPEKVADVLVSHKQAYFNKVKQDFDAIFTALHAVLQEDQKLLADVQDLINELGRDQNLPPEVRRVIVKCLNICLKTIEKGINDGILANLAGIDSAMVSSFKLLERESQAREIIGELKKGNNAFKEYSTGVKMAMRELKQFEKHFDIDAFKRAGILDDDHPDRSISGQTQRVVKGLVDVSTKLVILLNEVHNEFQAMRSSEQGRGVKPDDLDPNHAPSVKVLEDARTSGGLGFPLVTARAVDKTINEIETYYKTKLKGLLEESRLFMSEAEHKQVA